MKMNQNKFNTGDLVCHNWFNKEDTIGMILRKSKKFGYYQVYWVKVSEKAADRCRWMTTYFKNGFSEHILSKY
ncbi:MAG: hypothetical protein Q8P20_00820 [bacterium]|nr:hypothetical protein [bacterium]